MSCLLLILGALTFGCSNGEKKDVEGNGVETTAPTIDTVQCINSIKKQYAEVNAITDRYDKVEKDILGQSAENGVMIAFYDKRDLKKIIATFYGETGQAKAEYYFDTKGDLFFIFKRTSFYDKPMYVKGSKIQSIEESRYYFCQNQLIRWLGIDNKPVSPLSNEFQDEAKFVKEDIGELRKHVAGYMPSEKVPVQADTVQCRYGPKCLDSGFIIKGSREASGRAEHVMPKNRNVPQEK